MQKKLTFYNILFMVLVVINLSNKTVKSLTSTIINLNLIYYYNGFLIWESLTTNLLDEPCT